MLFDNLQIFLQLFYKNLSDESEKSDKLEESDG